MAAQGGRTKRSGGARMKKNSSLRVVRFVYSVTAEDSADLGTATGVDT